MVIPTPTVPLAGERAHVAGLYEGRFTRLRLFDLSDQVKPVEILGPDNPASFQVHRPQPVHVPGRRWTWRSRTPRR